MKKGVVLTCFFVSLILMMSLAYAQTNASSGSGITNSNTVADTSSAIDKAYQCLKDEIDDKPGLSFEEAVFSGLALGNYGNVSKVLEGQKSATQECWPKSGCTIRETSQVALAYNVMGRNTNDVKNWILSKQIDAKDLAWYLETDIENQQTSQCSVKYDGKLYNYNIDENMKITGNAGPCLSVSNSGFLLKVRDSCLNRVYEVSCQKNFITALIYQRDSGSGEDCLNQNNQTCFVAPETHSGSSLGTTSEKINARCFSMNGNSCDFEGTIWASLALTKLNSRENATTTLPYLIALADSYGRYLPEAFLLVLTGDVDYYDSLIGKRDQGQFWDIDNSPYNRFYDTSIGMLGVGSSSTRADLQPTQDYLLSIQTKEGCWNNNNVKDTAFLLYSGWGRNGVRGGGGSTGSTALCEEGGFSCERLSECTNAGGRALSNFECTGVGICCSVKVQKELCSEQNGKVCQLNQVCDGNTFEASDGACCVGSCTTIASNTCELSTDAVCRNECTGEEIATSDSCGSTGKVCCVTLKDSGGSSWWIWILVILIILVVLGIAFRQKLQMWLMKMKGKIKTSPVNKTNAGEGATALPTSFGGPRFGSPPAQRMPVRRMPIQRTPIQRMPVRRPETDKEMEDTLKKLRDIGSGK